jgi:hypothetical protein
LLGHLVVGAATIGIRVPQTPARALVAQDEHAVVTVALRRAMDPGRSVRAAHRPF